ncbi:MULTISPECIES: putative holin-like toxin [Bacillus subtilis group]
MAVESALGLMFQFGILIVGILTLAHSFSNKKSKTPRLPIMTFSL